MRQNTNSHSPWVILGCAWLVGFAMFAPILCIPPIQHIIIKELLLSYTQVAILFSLPVIMLAGLAIPGGLLADRIGIRKATGIGIIVMAIGSIMRGTSTSFETLLAFTALFGAGLGLVFPNLPKLVSAWFPQEKAGLATGIYVTGITTAASLALSITLPAIFPITNTFQGVFYIWSIPVILAAVLWWIIVSDPPLSQEISNETITSDSVWKNRNLWLVTIMLFSLNSQFYLWTNWTPTLLIAKGASPELAAAITSVIGWASLPAAFLMPGASYKVGLRKPFLWASAIILAILSWSAINISVPLSWLLTVVGGIIMGGTFSILLALPAEMIPKESVGRASGMMLSIGYIGGLMGPWLGGYILDTTGTLNLAFIILIGIAIAWAVIAFLIPETGSRAKLLK